MKKTYQEKKKDLINSLSPADQELFLRVSGQVEGLIEEQIRNNISPLSFFLQSLSKLIDTKKDSVREDILNYLINNSDSLKTLKDNIGILINITRV